MNSSNQCYQKLKTNTSENIPGRIANPHPLLDVRDLKVIFNTEDGIVHAVNGVSFDVFPGETIGIVGESGSGKSVSVMSILGLIPQPPGRITKGEIYFQDRDLLQCSPKELRNIRGKNIAMVFQDPMTSLNPVRKVGKQIAEALLIKQPSMSKSDAAARSVELLTIVGVPDPGTRYHQYPHEFSGGMRQRAMIAMAIANNPLLLIADEPTTALDVTIQAQIVEVLQEAKRATNAATILITHDLGLVAEMSDRVVVMYAGRVVETGSVETIFDAPRHPYTVGLMNSLPKLNEDVDHLFQISGQPPSLVHPPQGCPFHPRCYLSQGRDKCRLEVPALTDIDTGHAVACHFFEEVTDADIDDSSLPAAQATGPATSKSAPIILRAEGIVKHFPIYRGVFRRKVGSIKAVDNITLELRAGETLGLVGESGCGKSTFARTLIRLLDVNHGRILLDGEDIVTYNHHEIQQARKRMQFVFQDPMASLDPRMKVLDIIAEPLRAYRFNVKSVYSRVLEMVHKVGLSEEHLSRYPHEFSGGQRQRIGIARALALNPEILILDEPVSALDVSIQAQVLNLLRDLQRELNLTYLFIAHDLSVVRHVSNNVAVMYMGKIVEVGEKHAIFEHPTHPYTQALLSAVPMPDPVKRLKKNRIVLYGDVPNPANPPSGCRFRTRCWKAQAICAVEDPDLALRGGGHPSACHFAEEATVRYPVK